MHQKGVYSDHNLAKHLGPLKAYLFFRVNEAACSLLKEKLQGIHFLGEGPGKRLSFSCVRYPKTP